MPTSTASARRRVAGLAAVTTLLAAAASLTVAGTGEPDPDGPVTAAIRGEVEPATPQMRVPAVAPVGVAVEGDAAPGPAARAFEPTPEPTPGPAPEREVGPEMEPGVVRTWDTVASWYGPGFAGNPTANGEIFDPDELTAAHKELPFGTRLRVSSLDTGRSVIVRVNDRGPYIDGREIDLSRAAADALGITGQGVADVRVEMLRGAGDG